MMRVETQQRPNEISRQVLAHHRVSVRKAVEEAGPREQGSKPRDSTQRRRGQYPRWKRQVQENKERNLRATPPLVQAVWWKRQVQENKDRNSSPPRRGHCAGCGVEEAGPREQGSKHRRAFPRGGG